MRLMTVIGARPQFVKAAVVSRALVEHGVYEDIIHTGQHYDPQMSDIFFSQLGLKLPAHHLKLGGGTHGQMTGRMIEGIEALILRERPDRVLVYGDTNSTLAGALAAAKLHVPVVHVEAGLRSYDRNMPEELNRILTDQLSDVLCCPTDQAVKNLTAEGAEQHARIVRTGDVMYDAALLYASKAMAPLGVKLPDTFILTTLHRAENTDHPDRLIEIIRGLEALNKKCPVVMTLHPRTRNALDQAGLRPEFRCIDPVGYFEMLWLLQHCALVATDSGGVQKEAFFHEKYCLTLRDTTEWVELVNANANVLVGADADKIQSEGVKNLGNAIPYPKDLYGDGNAAKLIAQCLL